MDFEVQYGNAKPPLAEFFPGDLRPLERDWWAGNREGYDAVRKSQKWRGIPRSARANLKRSVDEETEAQAKASGAQISPGVPITTGSSRSPSYINKDGV